MKPLQFPETGPLVAAGTILEEESLSQFNKGEYYPVCIGDVYASKYQILGELGFGTTATVWLARNLQ